MKMIVVNANKCSGCRLCELSCSLKMIGEFNPARARMKVIGFEEPFALPLMCFQCEDPYCAEICPSGAITKERETGVIKISKQKCTGCKMCILACPFGTISFSSDEKIAVKCELCGGEPECVEVCPTGALEFRQAELAMNSRKRSLMGELKEIPERIKLRR
jgi:anaerobic carbon-monoxide dehydrogenase iron sulfur subunit